MTLSPKGLGRVAVQVGLIGESVTNEGDTLRLFLRNSPASHQTSSALGATSHSTLSLGSYVMCQLSQRMVDFV